MVATPDPTKLYMLRMSIKPIHRCPSCSCAPRDVVETSFDKSDLLTRLERAMSAEAQATQKVVDWGIYEASIVWDIA